MGHDRKRMLEEKKESLSKATPKELYEKGLEYLAQAETGTSEDYSALMATMATAHFTAAIGKVIVPLM